MSRSGYCEDIDSDEQQRRANIYRGAVASAFRGRRGQAFLKEMLAALDAMPEKKLIAGELEQDGAVCAIGAVGKARGLDMSDLDPYEIVTVALKFGVADALAREIAYENDDPYRVEDPWQRYDRMRKWIKDQILSD